MRINYMENKRKYILDIHHSKSLFINRIIVNMLLIYIYELLRKIQKI